MSEYQQLLDEYKSDYYRTYKSDQKGGWGDCGLAGAYLDKYWLTKDEYESFWLRVKGTIFNPDFQSLPEKVFRKEFELIPLIGGAIFSAEDFDAFKACLKETGDEHFVIVQNTYGEENPIAFRMKFPADISWDELVSGNYISTVLFEMFHNDYFIFGDSGVWGKYVENDADPPLDLIGVKHEFVHAFLDRYKPVRATYEALPESIKTREIIESLPASYKTDYLIH
jgi:hypothetical protein